MCKAHVLRFYCGHGVLMSLERCNTGPCPLLKTTSSKLPQQPYRCYNCQHKMQRSSFARSASSRGNSCTSSSDSLESSGSLSTSPPQSFGFSTQASVMPCHPLPGVAVQPSSTVQIPGAGSSGRKFSFACNGSNHFATPHYTGLPHFLPHQNHPCPPCQMNELRNKADNEVVQAATTEYPHLKEEMLVRDGRIWEDWQTKPTLEKYVDEKRTEEREMWFHVTRKWTQDLKNARVLVSEEDGLGLLG